MALNDAQLRRYDSNVLRLPADKRTEYHEQVDRLIDNLCKNVRNKTEIKITKVVKAGSFAKFTILRRTSEDPVDVDVVFYIEGKDADAESLESLSSQIHDLLVDQYPNKSVEDFKIQRKAATVQFVGSGLAVDIVPVIEDDTRDGYGWQFDLSDGSKMETCAPCQIKFVRDRKNADKDFRTLVRMGKRWRNRAEIKLKSFMIELIFAYLLDRDGPEGGIEQKFRDFLLYIAQSGLKETISFPENSAFFRPQFDDPVVILDPVCSSNNVASRVTEDERLEIVAAAQEAWEAAYFASTEDDDEVWKEIFGPKFNTEDA